MKKLKVILVMLCAMLVSVGLFACKKTEESGTDIANIAKFEYGKSTVSELTFTDNDTWTTIQTEVNEKAKLTIRPVEGDNYTLTGADCDLTSTIAYDSANHCKVGRYTITMTPKENNPKKVSRSVDLVVAHAFAVSGDREVCGYCAATRISADEDAIIHYGGFHKHGSTHTGIPEAVYFTEFDQDGNPATDGSAGKAFYNKGAEAGNKSYIEQFGTVNTVDGETYTVPTLTVGKLEPGMTITVKGTAWSRWGTEWADDDCKEDKGWFFPVIGIADRFLNNPAWDGGAAREDFVGGGTSVFVRGEGWVLYNGVDASHADSYTGKIPRLLSGLGEGNDGSRDTRNYGSHENASHTSTEKLPANYTQGQIPSAENWTDWVVYSTGEISQSGAYSRGTQIELTWNYREDGVIELLYNVNDSKLIAYIKVPDATMGYYDTMLHGDFVDMHIESYERIETRTPSEFFITVNNTNYYEGQTFNPETVTAQFTYEQTGSTKYPQALTLDNIYASTKANAGANDDDANWVSLATSPVLTTFNTYMVKVAKGGEEWTKTFAKDAIKVVANNIKAAAGADVDAFKNNNMVGELTISTDGTVIKLTPVGKVYAQDIPAGQTFSTTPADGSKYVALNLKPLSGTLGAITNSNVPYIYNAGDGTLVLALTKTTTTVEIEGLNSTKTIFDFSSIKGFDVTATATQTTSNNGWYLNNEENEVIVTFKPAQGATLTSIEIDGYERTLDQINAMLEDGGSDWSHRNPKFTLTKQGTSIAQDGTVTLRILFGAADLNNYVARTVAVNINGAKELEYKLDYRAGFVNGNDVDAGYYNYVAGNKIYLVKAADNGGDRELMLNVNAGNDNLAVLNLAYTYENGKVAFMDTGLEGASIKLLNIANTDLAIIEVDPAAYEIPTAKFGYQLKTASGYSTYYYAVADGKVERNSISGAKFSLITPGDCYDEGLAGMSVHGTVGSETVDFLASADVIGGQHRDADGDNFCDLCGGKMQVRDLPTWGNTVEYTIKNGDIVDIAGTYAESISTTTWGNFGLVVSIVSGHRYWLRTDGYLEIILNSNWDTRGGVPYDEERRPDGVKTAGTSLDYNVLNGVLTMEGETIDTVDVASFAKYLQGKSYRVIVSFEGTTITVDYSFYNPDGSLSFNYQIYVYEVTESAKLYFTADPKANTAFNPTFAQSTLGPKSVIKSAEGADYNDGTTNVNASSELSFTADGFSDDYAVLTAKGMASKYDVAPDANTTHYAAFKISFKQALSATTEITVEGITGAKAMFDDNTYKSIRVYVPMKAGTTYTNLILKFKNYEAYTSQADILIDLSGVGASDITATVTGDDALTINEGSFTIAYSGGVEATDKIAIGDDSVAISELFGKNAGNAFAFGNTGYSAYVTESAITDGAVTVTFVKAAADLTKTITGVTINLMRGTSLLKPYDVAPAVKIADNTDNEIKNANWYVLADGTSITFYSNDEAPSTIPLILNAGAKTEKAMLGAYEVTFTVSGDTATFKEKNALTKAATIVYSVSGTQKLFVITVDLKTVDGLGITTADVAYGYQLTIVGNYYYNVAATTREIEEVLITESGEKTVVREATCLEEGIKAYTVGSGEQATFYYNLEAVATSGHTWKSDSLQGEALKGYDAAYECENECGTIKYVQSDLTQTWGTGSAGAYDGWGQGGAANWEKFATVYQGGKYIVVGTNYSNKNAIWNMPSPGLAVGDVDPDGFRPDGWNFELNKYKLNPKFTFKDNKGGGATAALVYKALSGQNNNAADGKFTGLDEATLTLTFDYTNAAQIVITMNIVKGEDIDVTITITCTPEAPAAAYTLWMHQDGNKYAAASNETQVPAGKEAPAALSKHVHGSWNDQDRCPDDGFLNPSHGHNYTNGVCRCGEVCVHNFDVTTGMCANCDMKRTEVADSKKTYQASEYPTSFTGDTKCAVTAKLIAGQEVVFTAKLKSITNTAAWAGIVTQIWAFDESGDSYTRANELAFQQGNNWCLTGAWVTAGKGTAGNGNAYAGGATLQSFEDNSIDRTGYTYEVAVRFINGTVYVSYRLWQGEATGTPAGSGMAIYTNVTETELAVGWGPDGGPGQTCTFEDGITIVTMNIVAKA